MNGADNRKRQVSEAPSRRYEDAKAASASAADRISNASKALLDTFRDVHSEEYNRPRAVSVRTVEA